MISIKTDGIKRLMELALYAPRTPEVLWQGVTCATCGTDCGCRGCIAALPCRCTKICNGCYKNPCICRLICYGCGQYPCDCLPPPCAKCGTYPCECLLGFKSEFFKGRPNPNGRILVPVEPRAIVKINPQVITTGIITNHIITNTNNNIILTGEWEALGNFPTGPAPRPRPILSIQSAHRGQFYKPWMDSLGTDDDKKIRRIAINFRNQVLGEKARDLYSPHGFQVASKKWKGRIYVFYAHHQSAQIYDHGINVGRLDIHVPDEQDIPFGDLQLAFILAALHDEENMIFNAQFSPVRSI
jgi:hypothetical protein